MELKTSEVRFRLSPIEKLVIEIKASQERISVSEYLRKRALDVKK
jgi:hypothetical protein